VVLTTIYTAHEHIFSNTILIFICNDKKYMFYQAFNYIKYSAEKI
jgi:hypothetical protein